MTDSLHDARRQENAAKQLLQRELTARGMDVSLRKLATIATRYAEDYGLTPPRLLYLNRELYRFATVERHRFEAWLIETKAVAMPEPGPYFDERKAVLTIRELLLDRNIERTPYQIQQAVRDWKKGRKGRLDEAYTKVERMLYEDREAELPAIFAHVEPGAGYSRLAFARYLEEQFDSKP